MALIWIAAYALRDLYACRCRLPALLRDGGKRKTTGTQRVPNDAEFLPAVNVQKVNQTQVTTFQFVTPKA